jgi:hypothetical protein
MPDNPLKAPILALIKSRPSGLREVDLIRGLPQDSAALILDGQGSKIALFRKHFLVMNALYQLQADLFEKGLYLSISPLAIRLEPVQDLGLTALPVDGVETALRDYYLDWDHYEQTDRTAVTAMLRRFWGRYLAIDKRVEALRTLELPTDAKWKSIRKSYRRLVARHHPDKGGDPVRFRAVREAYEILLRCYAP